MTEGGVPRFFFNIHKYTVVTHDEDGVELPDMAAVRQMAMRALPAIAAHEVRAEGDHLHYAVVVTDQDGHPVYSATLSYTGLWLTR